MDSQGRVNDMLEFEEWCNQQLSTRVVVNTKPTTHYGFSESIISAYMHAFEAEAHAEEYGELLETTVVKYGDFYYAIKKE